MGDRDSFDLPEIAQNENSFGEIVQNENSFDLPKGDEDSFDLPDSSVLTKYREQVRLSLNTYESMLQLTIRVLEEKHRDQGGQTAKILDHHMSLSQVQSAKRVLWLVLDD